MEDESIVWLWSGQVLRRCKIVKETRSLWWLVTMDKWEDEFRCGRVAGPSVGSCAKGTYATDRKALERFLLANEDRQISRSIAQKRRIASAFSEHA